MQGDRGEVRLLSKGTIISFLFKIEILPNPRAGEEINTYVKFYACKWGEASNIHILCYPFTYLP